MTAAQALIIQMRLLQADMLRVSIELHKRELFDQADQLAGEAKMINTWIEGIEEESRDES
jgi:hypothetical protein